MREIDTQSLGYLYMRLDIAVKSLVLASVYEIWTSKTLTEGCKRVSKNRALAVGHSNHAENLHAITIPHEEGSRGREIVTHYSDGSKSSTMTGLILSRHPFPGYGRF